MRGQNKTMSDSGITHDGVIQIPDDEPSRGKSLSVLRSKSGRVERNDLDASNIGEGKRWADEVRNEEVRADEGSHGHSLSDG